MFASDVTKPLLGSLRKRHTACRQGDTLTERVQGDSDRRHTRHDDADRKVLDERERQTRAMQEEDNELRVLQRKVVVRNHALHAKQH